jgi:DNA-binding beta-propeller fold protein YncE
MILRDRYDGGSSPLEGDRELVLRHLPSDARVVRARATVIPVDPGAATGQPFVETLAFRGNVGDLGATKSASTAGGWVEVDFHARRTVVGLSGQLGGNVQADLGGGFVPISDQGTFLVPPQGSLTVSGSSAVLPSLTATRLRLFGTPGQALDVTSVRVRSAPSGVRLSLQGRPALWFHTGDLTRPETTPDFGDVLQAYLDDAGTAADTEDGVWLLPFVLHSDALGRLAVELEIEYLRRVSVLPGGVQDAALSFDHGGLPKSGGALGVSLPGDARVAGGSGRVSGAFESTRVAFGPTGAVTPAGALTVAPGSSPAHPVVLPEAVEAVAVDLLLSAVTRTASLQLDLRLDLDGKPAGESILPAPVPFPLDREMAGQPTWISVPLAAPLQLKPGQEKAYWLVVQSLEGEAAWSVEPATGSLPPMQLTQDGGFSWRRATIPSGPVSGLFRLRTLPGTFRMPIELRVGSGGGERRVSLSRFEPQGRVDLALDLPEIATAFNEALESAPGRCPEAEHLVNGGFERWIRTGSVLGRRTSIRLTTEDEASFDQARLAVTPDGRTALVATSNDANEVALRIVSLDREEVVETVQAGGIRGQVAGLAIDPGSSRAWVVLRGGRIWTVDLAGRRSLGDPLLLESPNDSAGAGLVTGLAVSPDGGRLFVVLSSFQGTGLAGGQSGQVIALDVRLLEEAALRGEPDAASAVVGGANLPVVAPAAVVVSPGGARLHVLASTLPTANQPSRAEVVPIETAALRRRDDLVRDLGASAPRSLAFAPDGRLVAVLDDQVVLERGEGGTAVTVAGEQAALAVDPDGSRAFVVGEEGLTIVDLRRRTAAAPVSLGGVVSDVAVTPGGDRVLAVIPSTAILTSIPVGPAVPAAWTVTSGSVQRWTGRGLGPAALLGEIPRPVLGNRRELAPVATAAISQVVPVAAGCAYELAFEGIASERDAVAEVLWKTGDCGTARMDTVDITPIADEGEDGPTALAVHRNRFQAPAGATQAEVRFRAPAGVLALVDAASFRGTAASVANGNLTGTGLPEPWAVDPEGSPGFSVAAQGDGLRLRNAGTAELAVAQEIELGEGRDFFLEAQARTVAGSGRQPARVEILWLPGGTAVSWELPVEGFDTLSARGTAPEGTVRAGLRLALPPGTAMDVRSVDLRFPEPARVPVTFVAQAPGELAVLGWELLYDQVPMTRPPVPAGGLCVPERPPLAAGEASEGDCCCDEEAPSATAAFRNPTAPVAVPVTVIPGIGPGRNRLLREAGMDSLQALADASPEVLREVLPGTPQRVAVEIILAARRSLRRG